MKRLIWGVMLGLAGCVPMAQVPVGGACGAAAMQGLVGQDAAVLEGLRFSQPVRVIRPGMAVTMEYSEGRLTIEVDEAGVIVALRCG